MAEGEAVETFRDDGHGRLTPLHAETSYTHFSAHEDSQTSIIPRRLMQTDYFASIHCELYEKRGGRSQAWFQTLIDSLSQLSNTAYYPTLHSPPLFRTACLSTRSSYALASPRTRSSSLAILPEETLFWRSRDGFATKRKALLPAACSCSR